MGLLSQKIQQLGRPAILLGNGLNLYAGAFQSWGKLLEEIGGVRVRPEGLTNTEIYDFIELRSDPGENLKYNVAKKFELSKDVSLDKHLRFLEIVREQGCPVLTTNFDFALEKAKDLSVYRTSKSGFTDYYPWDMYYALDELERPHDGFGVWHIHGKLNYFRSIRLGLTDYMGAVERARKMIHKGDDSLFRGKNQNDWEGKDTWLHIWFNMPLLIVGLGMGPDEVFMRWLLIERKRYFNQFPDREKKTMYLSTGTDDRIDNFLFNLNVEHYGANSYESLYT